MKKVLVFISALALCAGGAFGIELADGVTLGAEVGTGLYVVSQDDDNDDTNDTHVYVYNTDAGRAARLALTFKADQDWGGFKGYIRWDGASLNDGLPNEYLDKGSPDDYSAYGWVNLLGNKLSIYGGDIGDALWGCGGVIDTSYDAVKGIRFEAKPIEGLSVGIALPFVAAGPTTDSAITVPSTLEDVFLNSVIGAKYAVPGGITVSANLGLQYNWGLKNKEKKTNEDKQSGAKDVNLSAFGIRFLAGVDVPLGAVGVNVTTQFLPFSAYQAEPQFQFDPKVTYNQDKLSFYAQFPITVPLKTKNEDGEESNDAIKLSTAKEAGDVSIAFEVSGSYKVADKISAGLALGSSNVAYLEGNGLYVKPKASFVFSDTLTIEAWDKISGLGGDEEKVGKAKNALSIYGYWSF